MSNLIVLDHCSAARILILNTILPSIRSKQTQRVYTQHLNNFITFMESGRPFTRQTVMEWIAEKRGRGLSASTLNQSLAAVKKLAYEARYSSSGAISEEVYRGIEDIKGEKKEGRRTGNWLTLSQFDTLIKSIPTDLTGRRDRALLAVLMGCALRRDELLKLKPNQMVQREGRWVFADVLGKGNKFRTVPIPAGVAARIGEWTDSIEFHKTNSIEIPEFIFCPVSRGGHGVEPKALSESAIAYIVRTRAESAGLGKLAPHDLRRTYAKIARKNGSDLDQIQVVLGHGNVSTTQIYVGSNQNLQQSPADSFKTDWGAKLPEE